MGDVLVKCVFEFVYLFQLDRLCFGQALIELKPVEGIPYPQNKETITEKCQFSLPPRGLYFELQQADGSTPEFSVARGFYLEFIIRGG